MADEKKDMSNIDFSKLTPEEQKKISKEHLVEEEQNELPNEVIAKEAKKKLDRFRSDHVQ